MDFDPFSRDYFVDPYPIYRQLRDEQPISDPPRSG